MSREAMKLALEEMKVGNYNSAAERLETALAEQPAQKALDKMAENARELGLDYEPARDSGIVTAGGADPRTQRTWVGLTDEEYINITDSVYHKGQGLVAYYKAIEAKLKEKNNG